MAKRRRKKEKPVPKKKTPVAKKGLKSKSAKTAKTRPVAKPKTRNGVRKTSTSSKRGKRSGSSTVKNSKAEKALAKKRSASAVKGWETRKRKKRNLAAKKGWDKRREKYNAPIQKQKLIDTPLPENPRDLKKIRREELIRQLWIDPELRRIALQQAIDLHSFDPNRSALKTEAGEEESEEEQELRNLFKSYVDKNNNIRKHPSRLRWYNEGDEILRRLEEVSDEYGPYSPEFYGVAEDISDEYEVEVKEVFNFFHSH